MHTAETNSRHIYTLAAVVGLCFFLLTLFIPSQTFDWWSYLHWAEAIRKYELAEVYVRSTANYMPLSMFAIHLWQLVANWLALPLHATVHWMKLYPICFDFLTVVAVLFVARNYKYSLHVAVVALLGNVAFHYNSLIWGQFDSVYTFFVFLCSYFIVKNKFGVAALMYLLALNAKLQALIFFPVLLLLAGAVWSGRQERVSLMKNTLRAVVSFAALCVVQLLLFLPFSTYSPHTILGLIWSRSASLSTFVTFNADNFWIIAGAKTMSTLDTLPWLFGLSYKVWGYIFFFFCSGIALFPLLLELRGVWKKERQEYLFVLSQITLFIISLNFFFFLTQMHERYAHPAILFATMIFLARKHILPLILVSVAYVLNMDRVNKFWIVVPKLAEVVQLDKINAWCYCIALGAGFWLLWLEVRKYYKE